MKYLQDLYFTNLNVVYNTGGFFSIKVSSAPHFIPCHGFVEETRSFVILNFPDFGFG